MIQKILCGILDEIQEKNNLIKMKIFFRCRGGKFQGWGNVVRLARIAEHLHKKKIKILFIYEGDSNLKNFLRKFKFKKVALEEDISIKKEMSVIKKLGKPKFTFLEMLDANLNLQYFYKSISEKLIILDDLLDKVYISDYLLCCQSQNIKKKQILKNNNTKIFIDSKYFPFNKNLLNNFKSTNLKKKISKVLVFLGGGNYENALLKCAIALKSFSFEKVTFVLPPNINSNLKKQLENISNNYYFKDTIYDVKALFNDADLAVVSGGYTKLEAAIMRKPCILIQTQWHQKNISSSFSKKTGCPDLGHMSSLKIEKIIFEIKKLKALSVRKKILTRYRNVVSRNGINNILKEVGISA